MDLPPAETTLVEFGSFEYDGHPPRALIGEGKATMGWKRQFHCNFIHRQVNNYTYWPEE